MLFTEADSIVAAYRRNSYTSSRLSPFISRVSSAFYVHYKTETTQIYNKFSRTKTTEHE